MNVLIVANKKDARVYEAVIKKARDANLLGTIYSVGASFLNQIKDRYHPHIIIFDTSVAHMKQTDLMAVLKDLNDTYPYIKLIVFTSDENEAEYLKTFCFAVIDSPITSTDMFDILKNAEKPYEENAKPIAPMSEYKEPYKTQVLSQDMLPYQFPVRNKSENSTKKEDNTDVKIKTLKIILIAVSSLLVVCLVLFGMVIIKQSAPTEISASADAPSTAASLPATEDTATLQTAYVGNASEDEVPATTAVLATETVAKESEVTVSATLNSNEVLRLNASALILTVNRTYTLTVQGGTGKTLKWMSSDESVATVDQKGNVKTISGGSAYIYVSDGTASDYCLIAVNDKED